jgi:hypothetical protein
MILSASPQARAGGEATVGHFETGPLHNKLEKGWSEPSWMGYFGENSYRLLMESQEISFKPPERLQIQVCRIGDQAATYDLPK